MSHGWSRRNRVNGWACIGSYSAGTRCTDPKRGRVNRTHKIADRYWEARSSFVASLRRVIFNNLCAAFFIRMKTCDKLIHVAVISAKSYRPYSPGISVFSARNVLNTFVRSNEHSFWHTSPCGQISEARSYLAQNTRTPYGKEQYD